MVVSMQLVMARDVSASDFGADDGGDSMVQPQKRMSSSIESQGEEALFEGRCIVERRGRWKSLLARFERVRNRPERWAFPPDRHHAWR